MDKFYKFTFAQLFPLAQLTAYTQKYCTKKNIQNCELCKN